MEFVHLIPPHPDELSGLRSLVGAYLVSQAIDPSDIDVILLCLEEACSNAIVHGRSKEDIEVRLHSDGSRLTLRVRDRGRGVVLDELLPITMPDPLCCGGRGLPLIQALMNELEIAACDPGLEVRMGRRLRRAGEA